MGPHILALADILVDSLRKRKWTLATAESCTGGLLSAYLTANPGVSDVFMNGTMAYSNLAKMEFLGVGADTIEVHGAVSEQVAVEMAEGAAASARTDVGLGLTGVAGPGGGTAQKPVGLVFGAVCIRGTTQTHSWNIAGNRSHIREESVKHVLVFASRVLKDLDGLRRH